MSDLRKCPGDIKGGVVDATDFRRWWWWSEGICDVCFHKCPCYYKVLKYWLWWRIRNKRLAVHTESCGELSSAGRCKTSLDTLGGKCGTLTVSLCCDRFISFWPFNSSLWLEVLSFVLWKYRRLIFLDLSIGWCFPSTREVFPPNHFHQQLGLVRKAVMEKQKNVDNTEFVNR